MKRKLGFVFAILTLISILPLLNGCEGLILFNPKGPIGESERIIILVSFALMLLVVVPVIIMSIWFPLKYRESNKKANYDPNWSYSRKIEIAMWVIPLVIVLILSSILWRETHRLDPYKPIASEAKTLNVEVVSMDWKWLFIYPEQKIAVINQLVFPVKAPVSFTITSDTVMTSFFIPQLGSQIYAMGGMRTKLNLLADDLGDFAGQNQQFSGAGFPNMTFRAMAVTPEDFESWAEQVKLSANKLDFARFEELRKPGLVDSVVYFSSIQPGLFEHIVNEYGPMTHDMHDMGEMAHGAHGK